MNAFIQFVKANKVTLAVGTVLIGSAVALYYRSEHSEDTDVVLESVVDLTEKKA